MPFFTVDRIQDGYAFLIEEATGKTRSLSLDSIDGAVHDGSVVTFDGAQYHVDAALEHSLREEAKSRMESLFSRTPPHQED